MANILDTTKEIAQDVERDLDLQDGWDKILNSLSPLIDPEEARKMLGL